MNADVEFHIRHNHSWGKLPPNIKQLLGDSQREYEKYVVNFSIRNQLRYKGNVVRTLKKDEKHYYEELLQYSREHLMLFPYHLSDVIVKGMRITPFQYYCNIIQDLMEQERSYDSLPNFTAADCLRLLGIGRNQYIDLMNQCRSSKKFFRRKSIREIIPAKPVVDVNIDPWWILQIGYITEDDIKMVLESEKQVIDHIIDNGPAKAGDMNVKDVHSLYGKGLVYLDVPINDDDYIVVPPLEGFVMNRVLGDYFETLLYKIFVSIDEHTPVSELANVLQIDLQLVKNAISMYCRLGFARRKNTDLNSYEYHPSWAIEKRRNSKRALSEDPLLFDWNVGFEKINVTDVGEAPAKPSNTLISEDQEQSGLLSASHTKKIVFLFDSTLTAYLMMGNLSPGLKSHAVTMFEVGKLSEESLESLLQELDKVADVGEGEAQRYFDHALTLRSTILFLRHNRNLCFDLDSTNNPLGLDLIRCESLQSLEPATCARLLNKNYALLVSMAPLSNEIRTVPSCTPPHLGPPISEVNSVWFKLFLYHLTGCGPPSLLLVKGTRVRRLPKMFHLFDRLLVTTWGHDPGVLPTSNVLLTLNDALTHSAVLVQAYGISSDGELEYLPFPFETRVTDGTSCPKESLHSHCALKILSQELDLTHSCGYVTMLRLSSNSDDLINSRMATHGTGDTVPVHLPINGFKDATSIRVLEAELDQLDGEKGEEVTTRALESVVATRRMINSSKMIPIEHEWTLLDCNFGLPLFDAQLNKTICEKISSFGLCSKNSMSELTNSSQTLASKLLSFIAEFQGLNPMGENYLDGSVLTSKKNNELEVPCPVVCLAFFQGKLTVWTGS